MIPIVTEFGTPGTLSRGRVQAWTDGNFRFRRYKEVDLASPVTYLLSVCLDSCHTCGRFIQQAPRGCAESCFVTILWWGYWKIVSEDVEIMTVITVVELCVYICVERADTLVHMFCIIYPLGTDR